MAIRAIIIDDERLARNELKKLLQDHSDIEVIEEAANVDDGIEKIETLNPDLIFLDIQMPGKTGFDLLAEVEKAILKSDLSVNPSNDGNLIRIQIPELTEERRKEYVKLAKNKAEECKVSVRNIRRDGNDMIKALEKDKEISEDESKATQDKIQKITDKFIEDTQKLTDNKEKEILSL